MREIKIRVPIYCFVPLNPLAKCSYFRVKKYLFKDKTFKCTLFNEEVKSAAFPYIGVILPCAQCTGKIVLDEDTPNNNVASDWSLKCEEIL